MAHVPEILWFVLSIAPVTAQGLFSVIPLDRNPLPVVGTYVRGLAAGDIDGDGDEDLAIAQDNEAVLLRQQGGTLTRVVLDATTPLQTLFCAIADFDHDGRADVLFGPYPGPTMRIWWGDATGQFPTANPGSVPIASDYTLAGTTVRADDVDHDGDVDLILCKPPGTLANSATWYRNLGARSFAEASITQFPPTSSSLCSPFLQDVDGDGYSDVVLVSRNARTRLYWNNVASFAEATTAQFPVLNGSYRGFAIGDLDGDGDRDLVFGGDTANGKVLRCTGPRTFVLGPDLPADRCVALLAEDADGDGDLDLVAFRRDQGYTLRNDGAANFTRSGEFGACDETTFALPVDLDGDGDTDWLRIGMPIQSTATPSAKVAASYRIRPGVLQHVGGSRLPASTYRIGFASGDLEGDGVGDLFCLLEEGNNQVTLQSLHGDGHGAFTFHHVTRNAPYYDEEFVDVNRDGLQELFATGFTTSYLPNVGGELGVTPTTLPITTYTTSVASIDADGDGHPELLITLQPGTLTQLCLFEFDPVTSTWQDQTASRIVGGVVNGTSGQVIVADFDRDGDDDVWLRSNYGHTYLRNVGGQLVEIPGAIPSSFFAGYFGSCGDLDGDGDLDLNSGSRVALNRGDGTFVDVTARVAQVSGSDTLGNLIDLDDDGDLDLVGTGVVEWNNGLAYFTNVPNPMPIVAGNGTAFAWVDVDRDGDPDLIGSIGQAPAQVFTNMMRQFWLQEPAALGGAIELHYHARPGGTPQPLLAWFVCTFTARPPVRFGDYGWLQIDPNGAVVLGANALPAAGGEIVRQEPVPNDPALRGVFFCAQPIELRGTRWRIGGFASAWLGR